MGRESAAAGSRPIIFALPAAAIYKPEVVSPPRFPPPRIPGIWVRHPPGAAVLARIRQRPVCRPPGPLPALAWSFRSASFLINTPQTLPKLGVSFSTTRVSISGKSHGRGPGYNSSVWGWKAVRWASRSLRAMELRMAVSAPPMATIWSSHSITPKPNLGSQVQRNSTPT